MNKFKVYLAGPISGLTYSDGQEWREYAKRILSFSHIDGYSPLRQKHFLREAGVLDGSYPNPLATDRGIMTRDRYDVQTSDVVLVNLLGADRLSIGTIMELGWADAYRKPVVVAMEAEGNLHEHPMVREAIGYRLPTLDAALAVTKAILLPNSLSNQGTI